MEEAEVAERILSQFVVQKLLRFLTARREAGECILERLFRCYCDERVCVKDRVRFGLLLRVLDRIRKHFKVPKQTMVAILRQSPVVRGLVVTGRSVGRYGLTRPQLFCSPLLVVWNFTQACNLRCLHCYQNARCRLSDELSLACQLRIVDDIASNDVPLLAFSGGEPLLSENFWPVAARAAGLGLQVSLATNGTLLTKEVVNRLADVGVRYVEISLDSVEPRKHDALRGPTAWRRTVEGIANAAAVPGLVLGVAATITRLNVDELDSLIGFARHLGARRFYAFNFVPTGRGRAELELDLSSRMREQMLRVLHRHLNAGEIEIMSTAPQFGRVCVAGGPHGVIAAGHFGSARGGNGRKVAKYIGGCGSGRCYCAVQPNGVVTPCVFMPIPVGDLREHKLEEIWQGSPVLAALRRRDDNIGNCGVCRYRYYCGGCRARAFAYTGDFKGPDPGCVYNEEAWSLVNREERPRPCATA